MTVLDVIILGSFAAPFVCALLLGGLMLHKCLKRMRALKEAKARPAAAGTAESAARAAA